MASLVSTPVFEGPFDVLLQLVLDHKVDVCEVPMAPVVDAFLAHVAASPKLDLAEATEFLVIASVLVELKSRRLLPGPDEVDFQPKKIAAQLYTFTIPNDIEKGEYGILPPGSANQRGFADTGKIFTFSIIE